MTSWIPWAILGVAVVLGLVWTSFTGPGEQPESLQANETDTDTESFIDDS